MHTMRNVSNQTIAGGGASSGGRRDLHQVPLHAQGRSGACECIFCNINNQQKLLNTPESVFIGNCDMPINYKEINRDYLFNNLISVRPRLHILSQSAARQRR